MKILLCLTFLHFTKSQISFYPRESVETLPSSSSPLQPLVLLEFALLPSSLQLGQYTSSWTLPSGETVSKASQSPDIRIFVQDTILSINSMILQGTTLLVRGLSYLDAGVYTCSVQDNNNPGNPPIVASIELRLLLTLTAIDTSVETLNNASSVELSCDMSNYIRPDDHLQWLKDGQLIVSGQNRATITFRNGTRNGQIGGLTIGKSRLSTLTISDPILSDSGVYTCRVVGTTESVDIQLVVQDSTTDVTIDVPNETLDDNYTALILGVTFSLTAILALVIIMAGIVTCIVDKRNKRAPDHHANTQYEDVIIPIPGSPSFPKSNIEPYTVTEHKHTPNLLVSNHSVDIEPAENVAYELKPEVRSHEQRKCQANNNERANSQSILELTYSTPYQGEHQYDIGMDENIAYKAVKHPESTPAHGNK